MAAVRRMGGRSVGSEEEGQSGDCGGGYLGALSHAAMVKGATGAWWGPSVASVSEVVGVPGDGGASWRACGGTTKQS